MWNRGYLRLTVIITVSCECVCRKTIKRDYYSVLTTRELHCATLNYIRLHSVNDLLEACALNE